MTTTSINKAVYGPAPNLKALADHVGGHLKASQLLSIGHSTTTRYIAKDHCPSSVDKLAGYILAERNGGTRVMPSHTLLMVRVPSDKLELLQIFLKGMSVQYSQFNMDT